MEGASAIIPVASLEKAEELKSRGYFVGAERNVEKCDFADAGNSPFDYYSEKVKGKETVFTTTNGTRAIELAAAENDVIIGAFCNISAVADFCRNAGKDVLVVCAGWNNLFSLEDTLFAGLLVYRLKCSGNFETSGDSAVAASVLWQQAEPDVKTFLQQSEHAKRLFSHHLEKDFEFCLTQDAVPVVPFFEKFSQKILI
jgi:2-phosphosulfolactate phosphatase